MQQNQDNSEAFLVTPTEVIEAGDSTATAGLLVLLRASVDRLAPGQVLEIRAAGRSGLDDDIAAWCRLTGNPLRTQMDAGVATRYLIQKSASAAKAQSPDWGVRLPQREGGHLDARDWLVGRAGIVPEQASTYLGFVPRGAVPEAGNPEYPYTLNAKSDVWADNIADLLEQSKSQAWNPSTDIHWGELPALPTDMERAVCQVMTFLAENEYSALYVPAKFLPRINAQFVEPVLYLAAIIQEEARHIEAFTKRALANWGGLQQAASLTEWSLHSLLLQEDYFKSSFLLHVLGEGTFLDLLRYVELHAPDPVTREVARRARVDEGRHVAYGVAHARYHLQRFPTKAQDLEAAVQERAAFLSRTAGENPALTEALAVLAGGGATAGRVTAGLKQVTALREEMHENRVRRMLQIGLSETVAQRLSEEHTPNFM